MRLGEILVAANVCDEEAIEKGLEYARKSKLRLGSALIELALVPSDTIAAALGKQHNCSTARETNFAKIEKEALALLSGTEAHARRALPLGIHRTSGKLAVAMCDPQDLSIIEALGEVTGKDIIVAAASEHRILQGLIQHYGPADSCSILPAQEPFELELAPSPILAKAARAPDAVEEDVLPLITNPPSPIVPDMPQAKVANAPPRFDLRSFLSTGRGIAIAAMALIVFIIVGKFAYNWITDKEIQASGHFEVDQVELQMTLPPTGWVYAPSADKSQEIGVVELAVAVLYRGKSLARPDDLFGLMRITGPFSRTVTEGDFQRLIDTLNSAPSRQMSAADFLVDEHQCAMSDRRPGLAAECVGSARYQENQYDFTAFFWFARDKSAIAALFLTKGEFISFDSEIDSIIQSIDIQ